MIIAEEEWEAAPPAWKILCASLFLFSGAKPTAEEAETETEMVVESTDAQSKPSSTPSAVV